MRRSWKSAVTAGLVAASMLLTACGGDSPKPGETAKSDVDPAIAAWAANIKEELGGKKITIAAQTHPSTSAMQEMTPAFKELTGIDVTWDIVDQNSLKQKIELDFQSGNAAYDIAMIDSFWLSSFAEKGIVKDLGPNIAKAPDFFDYNDILPAYRDGLDKYEGVQYGVQIAGETRFLGYRKDLFEKYDKQPPKTMDELLELARFFNGKDGVAGISMRAQKGIHFTSGLLTLMYQFSDGFFDAKTGANRITDPQNVQALQYYLDLLKNAPSDVASYTHEEALSAFMAGHAAMWFDATAIAPSLLDPDQSAVVDKVAFAPPPEGPLGAYGALAGWSLGITANGKEPDAAWAFISYMTSKAMAPTYVANEGVPTRTSVLENPQTDVQKAYYPAMLESLATAAALVDKGISWLPLVPAADEKLTIIGNYGSEALAGSMTAEEALERASKEVDAMR